MEKANKWHSQFCKYALFAALSTLLAISLALAPAPLALFADELPDTDETLLDDYSIPAGQTTRPTNNPIDLPINIDAIGRTVQPGVALSMRFIELDLFSATSQMVNTAIDEQLRHSRTAMGDSLFETFEAVRAVDVNDQIYTTAQNLNLFAEPMRIRQIGEASQSDDIPVWIAISALLSCAVLGYFIAKSVIQRKEGKPNVHNPDNRN